MPQPTTVLENSFNKYIQLEENYGAHNYHPLPVVIEKGEGVFFRFITEG